MERTFFVFLAIVITMPMSLAFAHTTIETGPYEIEVGWGIEPPIEGLRNTIVYSVTEGEGAVRSGVVNALDNLDIMLKFGGIEQRADILNDPHPGSYYTKIIPSRAGSYSIVISGNIADTSVNETISIENVEGANRLNFPPKSESCDSKDIAALRNALASMQRNLDSIDSVEVSIDSSIYDIAYFGAAFGIAGTVLAVVAMIRKR